MWDIKAPKDIVLRRVLVGHRAAVNVVDFDDRYIVSASGDRTIKVCIYIYVCTPMRWRFQSTAKAPTGVHSRCTGVHL